VRILISASRKAESTQFRAESVIAHDRLYVTVNAAAWHWTRLHWKRLKSAETARYKDTVALAVLRPPGDKFCFPCAQVFALRTGL
jgi:hypothetical protein